VSEASAVSVSPEELVAELLPGGERIVLRGIDESWRLVRFVDGDDVSVRPETSRRVALEGSGPDAVLAALGVVKPDGLELQEGPELLEHDGQRFLVYSTGESWLPAYKLGMLRLVVTRLLAPGSG